MWESWQVFKWGEKKRHPFDGMPLPLVPPKSANGFPLLDVPCPWFRWC